MTDTTHRRTCAAIDLSLMTTETGVVVRVALQRIGGLGVSRRCYVTRRRYRVTVAALQKFSARVPSIGSVCVMGECGVFRCITR